VEKECSQETRYEKQSSSERWYLSNSGFHVIFLREQRPLTAALSLPTLNPANKMYRFHKKWLQNL